MRQEITFFMKQKNNLMSAKRDLLKKIYRQEIFFLFKILLLTISFPLKPTFFAS